MAVYGLKRNFAAVFAWYFDSLVLVLDQLSNNDPRYVRGCQSILIGFWRIFEVQISTV